MLGRPFWKRALLCQEIEAGLELYRTGRLSVENTRAFDKHLAGCDRCRQQVDVEPAWLFDLDMAPPRAHLIEMERKIMRQAISQRMRRKIMMRNMRVSVQNVLVLGLLLVGAGLAVWQLAPFTPPPEEESAEVNSPAEPLQGSPEEEPTAITLAVEAGQQGRYRPYIDLFERENPDIRVNLVSVSEAIGDGEGNVRALAASFDVFPYTPNRQQDSRYLLDLRPYLNLDPAFDPADFLPGLLPGSSEPLWAVPTGAAYNLTFYDQAAFDEAGLPYPEPDWTSDDFLAAASALTVREEGGIIRWGYVPTQLRYAPLLAARLDGPLQSAAGLRLNDPDVAAAVEWVGDLFAIYEVAPWLDDYRPAGRRVGGDSSPMGLISGGQAAMWHTTHLLYDEGEPGVGITAVPQGPSGLVAEPLIFAFGVSRGTASPETAWKLVHFLSRQSPPSGGFPTAPIPARRSVATAGATWEQLPENLAPALRYTAENSLPPRLSAQGVEPLLAALTAYVDEQTPATVALDRLPEASPLPEDGDAEPITVPQAPVAGNPDSVEILFFPGISYQDIHRRLANRFHETYPAIRVRILEEEIVFNRPEDSLLIRAAGSDCAVGRIGDLTDAELRAALLPMGPLLALDPSLQPESFYPGLLPELTENGELLGIPAGVVIPYLEYNRRLFLDAGVEEPALDWTLDDFLRTALQLTTGQGESKQYGYAFPYRYFDVQRAAANFGTDLVIYDEPVADYDYAAAAGMLSWYTDLIRTHEVQPLMAEEISPGFAQFEALMREERIAMWSGLSVNTLRDIIGAQIPDFDLGIAAEPLGPSGRRVRPSGHGLIAYYIFADSPHAAACWEWIRFLATEPLAVTVQNQSYQTLPGHIETAESQPYIDVVGEEIAAVGHAYIDNLSEAPPSPMPEWMWAGDSWLREAYDAVITGEMDVPAALAEADFKFSQYRQCIIAQDAFEDPAAQLECFEAISGG